MTAQMLSALYMGQKSIEVKQVPVPAVGAHDVLIQNIYSSICGTDVAVYTKGTGTGHRITVGGEFGHETVSRVVAVGEQISDLQIGQRVYPYPRFAKDDIRRAGTIGGFSEYILIPNAKLNHSLYLVPDEIDDRTACLIEPFTVGCRAARRSQPQKGEAAAVFGCGTIGIAAAIALKWFGIEKVMVCDVSDFRLAIAAKMGFSVCNVKTESFTEKAKVCYGAAPALTEKVADVDIFIDAAGSEAIFDLYMREGKIESRYISVAVNNAIRQLDLLHLTYAQKSIVGSGGYMPEDVADVFSIMKSGKWDIASVITHEFPIGEIEQAIQTAENVDHALNVIIGFQNEYQRKNL